MIQDGLLTKRGSGALFPLPPIPSPFALRKKSPEEGSRRAPAPWPTPVEAELGWALWFTAFQQGHCYEPFVKYGNFSSSAPSYPVGTTVEFSCDPGYTLEQGSIIIECVDLHDPQWNETEPACRGQQAPGGGSARAVKTGWAPRSKPQSRAPEALSCVIDISP